MSSWGSWLKISKSPFVGDFSFFCLKVRGFFTDTYRVNEKECRQSCVTKTYKSLRGPAQHFDNEARSAEFYWAGTGFREYILLAKNLYKAPQKHNLTPKKQLSPKPLVLKPFFLVHLLICKRKKQTSKKIISS